MTKTLRVFLIGALLLALPAHAERVPKWELGLGLGTAYIPDYRGSDEYRTYIVPWPYVVYRGSALSLDREGLQSHLFGSARLHFVASINASTPVNSGKNSARVGMRNLGVAFEAGPMLETPLWYGEHGNDLLFQLPLRGVVAADARRADAIGWVVNPRVMWRVPHLGRANIDFDASAGPLYASNAYHDYYYRVEERYATPIRPAYDPGGGYSGTRITLAGTRRVGVWWFGAYLRYDNLAGTSFHDSPLLRTDHAFVASIGLSYILAQSQETVWR